MDERWESITLDANFETYLIPGTVESYMDGGWDRRYIFNSLPVQQVCNERTDKNGALK